MSGHAFLPPSGAECWVACAQWARVQQTYPDVGDKSAAEEGTLVAAALHEAMCGRPEPDGVTDEMRDAVEMAVEFARSKPGVVWNSERTIYGGAIDRALNYGTPDLDGWGGMVLHVADVKFGHRFVNHVGNWQCVNYAALLLEEAQAAGVYVDRVMVEITVIQPRCYSVSPVRTWSVSAAELQSYIEVLRQAAVRAKDANGSYVTGPHCRDCVGRHECTAFQTVAATAMDLSLRVGMTPASIEGLASARAEVLSALDRLKAYANGIEEQLLFHAKAGRPIPGLMLTNTRTREYWRIKPEQLAAVGEIFGIQTADLKPKTPSQVRKAFKDRKIPCDALNEYVGRPLGDVALAPLDLPFKS